jgi:hypothetical protein
MKCPKCGLENPESSSRCDCGYNFSTGQVEQTHALRHVAGQKQLPRDRPEVTVSDIRMPFWSMVVFMVKWAVASIPAVLILIVFSVFFWTAVTGLVNASFRGLFQRDGASSVSTQTTGADTESQPTGQARADELAYLNQVLVQNVRVDQNSHRNGGVFGELKNTGSRVLKRVEITIYCLGMDGKPVFEKTRSVVRSSDDPLKVGYSRQFDVNLRDAPSDWLKKVDVKVSEVQFP